MTQQTTLHITTAVGLALLSACSHVAPASVAAPTFPETISAEQRDQLFAAHALICKSGECARQDGAHDIRALAPQSYSRAKLELKRHDDFESTVTALGWGLTCAAGLAASLLLATSGTYGTSAEITGSQSDADQSRTLRNAGGALWGAGVAMGIISAFLPSMLGDPDELFEKAYNESLAADLDARVAADATVSAHSARP